MRANGVVSLKNIVVTGSNTVVDGFNVVGGQAREPGTTPSSSSGTGHKIVNNLVRGRGIWYAIGCEQSAGCGVRLDRREHHHRGAQLRHLPVGWRPHHRREEQGGSQDLFQSQSVDDVDAMRAWGTNHVVRNNYFQDINVGKSAGSPYFRLLSTGLQASGSPRSSSNILYENNYCVRVTGQRSDRPEQPAQRRRTARSTSSAATSARPTVAETIEMTGIPNITMDNNYVAGVQGTVLNFTNAGGGGKRSTNVKVRNSVLVRATSGSRYIDGTPADNTANRTVVDPAVKSSHDAFARSTTVSDPAGPTDFTAFYRDSVGRAKPTVVGAGSNTEQHRPGHRRRRRHADPGRRNPTSGRSSTADVTTWPAGGAGRTRPAPTPGLR